MESLREQQERLRILAAKNRQLAAETWQKAHVLDGLLAARKEALSASKQRGGNTMFGEVSSKGASRPAKAEGRSASSGAQQAASRPARGSGETPTLLVVEDDPNDFLLLKRALWKVGASARVWWAQEATEAMQLLKELESRAARLCVVADLQLPGFSGFELLEQIRALDGTARIRFAFLTGRYDRATEERAYACGADGFFVKCAGTVEMAEVARALQQLATRA